MSRHHVVPVMLLALIAVVPSSARATCDAIPGAQQGFRGAAGIADRPFARPGDGVTVRMDASCHPGAAPLSADAAQYVATLLFTGNGPATNAIVIRESCLGFAAERRACERTLDAGRALCVPAADVDFAVVPDAGAPALRFRFPDTDAMLGPANDGIGLAGPVTIAVTHAGEPLPCGLASARCRNQLGFTACIDELFLDDGACGAIPHPLFGHFTALPPANDFGALCTTPDTECTGTSSDVRIAVDLAGNLLVPMDWRRVLVRRADVPVARLLRAALTVDAFAAGGVPLRLPDDSVLGSFSVKGVPLPPIFTPQQDPLASGAVSLFGSADAPEGILRIARRTTCAGGPADGVPCQTDAQCAPSRCTGGLFDFSTRRVEGGGPLVLRRNACLGGARALLACATANDCPGGQCLAFTADAADPVPLDGLNRADGGYAFVVNEALLDEDRNGDGDRSDDVVQLVDSTTGTVLPITDGAFGRAVVRLREPPFSRPALAAAGDVVAFLEPEALAGDRDANDDGNRSDTLLRAFRLGATTAVDLAPGEALVADAAPLVEHESVAISGGKLFFRAPEAALARHTTTVASRQHDGLPVQDASTLDTPQSLSADGRWLVFVNYDDRIVPGDVSCTVTTECRDAFLMDRDADGDGLLDEAGAVTVTRVSASDPPRATTTAALSADAAVVAFISYAPLVAEDTNAAPDVYVRSRDGQLERASVTTAGVQAALGVVDSPRALALSRDGGAIAFASEAPLVADDTNDVADVYVRDRSAGTTRVSVGTDGIGGNDLSFAEGLSSLGISGEGRLVVFDSEASNLVAGDDNGVSDIFVHDRTTGVTTRVSVGVGGEQANGLSRAAAIAADGSAVAFISVATNLVPGVTSGLGDVFVHDLATRVTTVASIASDGTLADRASTEATFSGDGRFLAFSSRATTLVPDDGNGIQDVFVHDRTTGLTERANLRWDGAEQPNLSLFSSGSQPSLAADGRSVVFVASDDLAEGIMGHRLVYSRAPDPSDEEADLTHDGRLDDTVLRVLDVTAAPGTPATTLCPSDAVAVADGQAAFLRPENAGEATGCPPGPDLDGDGETDDLVVHFVDRNGVVSNLAAAASVVALSSDWIAALVPGSGGSRVHVHPATADGAWTSLGPAADVVEVRDDHVIFVTSEAADGLDLNDDGDVLDRVLQVANAATAQVRNIGYAVEDLVASETLVAFRVREAAQGATSLNGDGDTTDDVLFVYDLADGTVHETGQAVTPCRLEACDPRLPYRVLADTVRFLTFEAAQGTDLSGDDDRDDLVVQTFNVRAGAGVPAARARRGGRVATLAAVAAGVCSDTGAACGDDEGCGPEARCIVPPGTCVRDLGTSCRPGPDAGCGPGEFCGTDPGDTAAPTCRQRFGECRADTDCPAPARCIGDGQRLQRLVAPLAPDREASAVLPAVGRCVDSMGEAGSTCRTDADCAPAAICRADVITAAVADRDSDEVPDAVDFCPDVPDPAQRDRDGDGVGDACDRRTLGNDVREPGEECDGADDAACPGRCGPEATCVCANEIARGRARVSYRKAGVHLRARLRLPLESYDGEPVEVRLDGDDGHAVASAGVGTLRTSEPGHAWSVRGHGDGLQSIRLVRPRRDTTFQLDLSARRWNLADDAIPSRLTVTVGDQCFTVRVRAPRRQPASATTTSTTAPPTTTSVSSTTTTTTTTSTTVPPGTCCPAQRIVLETIPGATADENELRFGLSPPFPLPAGTRIVLDSGPPDTACRHEITIPPGGFEMSPLCVESLAWTADLIPRGCAAGDALGRGTLWDGGAPAADADLRLASDTRDGVCNPPREECGRNSGQAAANVLGRRGVTVGDGTADAPALNLMFELPAIQMAWDVREPPGSPLVCPDPDGRKHLATDTGQTAFRSTLRLTTASATAQFTDANGDGCSQSGTGSAAPRMVQGAAAPGPCCAVGQEMILAGADTLLTGSTPGDTLSHLRMRARIVACEPLPAAPARCDAVEGGGRLVTSMGPNRDWVSALVPAAGDAVVAVGTADVPSGRALYRHFALARYDGAGRLDTSFGPEGIGRVYTDFGYGAVAAAAALDQAGRIVVAGEAERADLDIAVARYTSAGLLDDSFGTGGLVVTDVAGRNQRAGAVAVLPDGRIVVAAHGDELVLLRYEADGSLDPTFGVGGLVRLDLAVDLNGAKAMAVLPDGRIVIGGFVQHNEPDFDWLLARFHADGSLDQSFGTGGIVTTALTPQRDEINALAVLDDGTIIAAGSSMPIPHSGQRRLVIGRYRADGTLDPAFGSEGLMSSGIADLGSAARAILALPGGTIVAAGVSRATEDFSPGGEPLDPPVRLLLARYDAATGEPDDGFGQGGAVFTSFGGWDDAANALLALPDGRLLAGGSFDPFGGFQPDGDFALARYLPDGRLDPGFGGECGWEVEPLMVPPP